MAYGRGQDITSSATSMRQRSAELKTFQRMVLKKIVGYQQNLQTLIFSNSAAAEQVSVVTTAHLSFWQRAGSPPAASSMPDLAVPGVPATHVQVSCSKNKIQNGI